MRLNGGTLGSVDGRWRRSSNARVAAAVVVAAVVAAVAGAVGCAHPAAPVVGQASAPTLSASPPPQSAPAPSSAAPSSAVPSALETREPPPQSAPEAAPATAAADVPATAAPSASVRSQDGARVFPVRSRDGLWEAFVRLGPPRELWLASVQDGSERRLLTESEADEPQRNLVGFAGLQFSPDGRTLYFLTEAWATSAALHALDLQTLNERFVIDAVGLLVIMSGKYAGHLFVQRHQYKDFPGEGFHAYQWCGVVDSRGKTVRTLDTDERLCPDHAPKDRAEIEAALGLKPGSLDAR